MVSERRRAMWRAKSGARRNRVLEAAIILAEEKGYREFSRQEVAQRAGLGAGSVSVSFGGMNGLRREVMNEAVVRGLTSIIAQGLVAGDSAAQNAPHSLKKQAADTLI